MVFSEEIKKLRQRLFMSQTAFAQELGVSYTTVNRWEMGRAKPTYKTMKLIDDYCKIIVKKKGLNSIFTNL